MAYSSRVYHGEEDMTTVLEGTMMGQKAAWSRSIYKPNGGSVPLNPGPAWFLSLHPWKQHAIHHNLCLLSQPPPPAISPQLHLTGYLPLLHRTSSSSSSHLPIFSVNQGASSSFHLLTSHSLLVPYSDRYPSINIANSTSSP